MNMSVDQFLAAVTRREQREAKALRKHEEHMKLIEEDSEGYTILQGMRIVFGFLIVVAISLASSCTARSIVNAPYDDHQNTSNNQQLTACEQAAAAASMSAKCEDGELSHPK